MTEHTYSNWRKSSRSDGQGNCVEVADSDDGTTIGVRDTKNRNGATLEFTRPAWCEFIERVRDGEFDLR